jgi:uncharacterized NAD-dependent epimerase/dehydratase family protein
MYEKNIYTFDKYIFDKYFNKDIDVISTKCFYPSITKDNIPFGNFGKMWVPTTPILGVFGTRSKQGKFTAQMILKETMSSRGYSVGHVATEPTGWLFNANAVFPFGYANTIDVNNNESILILNNIIHEVELSDVDIIIVGSQSGTIPYDFYSSDRITMAQTAFLYGTLPDAVLLCVCADDEYEYIERTINYIESASDGKVLGIIVFPVITELYAGSLIKNINIAQSDKLNTIIKMYEERFNIPCYELGKEGINKLADSVISYFS